MVFVLFGFTRLWQLTELPRGLHIDEAGMAYDAWSLSQYGVDRHLKSWPVYLANYGGGQSSLYAFLCALLFKGFGYSIWLVRFPAVVFSLLNLVFGMKLVRKIYPQSEFLPVISGFLLVICPYFIMASRFGLDCNLMLGMSTVFLYCFTAAIESGKIYQYVLAGIAGGILLYTYALVYVILPLFLLLMFLYLLRVKKFSLKGWFVMAVPLGILAFPLILVQIVNYFDLPEFRIGCFTITKLSAYRFSEVGRFQAGKMALALRSIFLNDDLVYNSTTKYANLYGITIAFCITGLLTALRKMICSVKSRRPENLTIVLLWFASVFCLECHIASNVNKVNGIFYTAVVLAATGMKTLAEAVNGFVLICRRKLAEARQRTIPQQDPAGRVKRCFAAALICIYGMYFLSFSSYYFCGDYREDYPVLPLFFFPVTEAVAFIEQDAVLSGKETCMTDSPAVYPISTLESPYILDLDNDGWEEDRYGNYRFSVWDAECNEECNYIIREDFHDFSEKIRAAGFEEKQYDGYSLFYKK